ncbi:MAG: hypothetical protein AAF965_00160, partial [Pseudomonadota bacterium]
MNPLLLLLGLFGIGAFGSSSSSSATTSASGQVPNAPPVDDPVSNTDSPSSDDVAPPAPSTGDATNNPPATSAEDDQDQTPTTVGITLVIYDANGDIVHEVANGSDIDFGTTDVSDFKVGAEIDGGGVASVVFTTGDATYTQHLAPYDMPAGAIDLTDGTKTVTVTAYSETNGTGDILATTAVTFETNTVSSDDSDDDDMPMDPVVGSGDEDDDMPMDPVVGSDDDDDDMPMDHDHGDMDQGSDDKDDTDDTPATVAISLVAYGDDGEVVENIADGDMLDFGMTDVSAFKIGAEFDGDSVASVVFETGGQT